MSSKLGVTTTVSVLTKNLTLFCRRVSGKTAWITIESEMGAPCLLRTDMKAPYTVQPDSIQHHIMANGTVQFDLEANQTVSIWSESESPDFVIKPAKGNEVHVDSNL